MKAKRIGIDCSRCKHGETYDAEFLESTVLCVQGKDFIYGFTYKSEEDLRKEWEIEGCE